MSAWIAMVPVAEATGELAKMYDRAKTPSGTVDNVMRVHSLRPHTMAGHVALYRSVLHDPGNAFGADELRAHYEHGHRHWQA